jgi:hypothetical protein
MSKHVSPLLGYNNNVRHKNRVFHIQTEDSGVKHPHIITHLFMDGGRILKSIKRSYAEHVGADKMQDLVKQMMKEQHKAMFIALRDGQFDQLLEDGAAAKEKEKEKEKEKAAATAAAVEAKAEPAPPPAPSIPPPPETEQAPPPPRSKVERISVPEPADEQDDFDMVPMTTRTPDVGYDDRPAPHGSATPALRQMNDLPPPPANLLRDKHVAGGYRASPPAAETPVKRQGAVPPSSKKPISAPPKKPPLTPVRQKIPSEGRYAAARPAAIFGQSRPQQGSSIFGEDLISDKSLDEVILSYLAEDLEPTEGKKK